MWDILHTRLRESAKRSDSSATPLSATKIGLGAPVNFKDLNLLVDDGDEHDDQAEQHSSCSSTPSLYRVKRRMVRSKQVIIMVGLPGRGKTWLCTKLLRYLNWLGHATKHVNVGSYRRHQKPDAEVQNADFFDAHNSHGLEARNRALAAALADLHAYLATDEGQIVIFDATNTTEERRQLLVGEFHGRYQYLFIESICNDKKVLEQNYVHKMMFSPDYNGVDTTGVETAQQAIEDFRTRVENYNAVYEPITNRNVHYIKLIDMVTGRGYMDVNCISGYIPGKIVFFLMQVCKAGLTQTRRIWLTRHGESEYNKLGLIGGDSELSIRGEEYARLLPDLIQGRLPEEESEEQHVALSVWTSTLKRTIQTADNLPFPKLRWKALDEIQAGVCDGLTYSDIEKHFPEEFEARAHDKLRYRYQAGESYLDVIMRLEPVIIEMERLKECVCVVSHQAVLRAIIGYFMGVPIQEIPNLKIPLHTLIELRPRPDGAMEVHHYKLDIPSAEALSQPPLNMEPVHAHATASLTDAAPSMPPPYFLPKIPVKVPFGATIASSSLKVPASPQRLQLDAKDGNVLTFLHKSAPRHQRTHSDVSNSWLSTSAAEQESDEGSPAAAMLRKGSTSLDLQRKLSPSQATQKTAESNGV